MGTSAGAGLTVLLIMMSKRALGLRLLEEIRLATSEDLASLTILTLKTKLLECVQDHQQAAQAKTMGAPLMLHINHLLVYV